MTTKLRFLLGGGLFFATLGYFYQKTAVNSVKSPISKGDRKLQMSLALGKQEFEKIVDPNTGTVPIERLVEAQRYAQRPEVQRGFTRASLGMKWTERGPSNVGGRTRTLLFDANVTTNKKVWAAGVGGGLWYTNDITATTPIWRKVNDFFGNIGVTTLAQSPANAKIMYFGTGEGWSNLDAQRGLGIWRSMDGGVTWAQLSSTNNSNFHYVQRIAIDKTGIVYAATRNGLYKSSDNGGTFTRVLGSSTSPASSNNNIADVEIGADGSIYASCGIFNTGQVWKSSRVTHGTNVGNVGNWANISPSGSFNRIEIACAPNNSSRVYVLAQDGGGYSCSTIFHSENGGTSWTSHTAPTIIDQGSNSNFTRGQAWYDLMAAVDPNNADVLYIGGVDALRSSDKGNTWSQISTWSSFGAPASLAYVHADIHTMAFAKGSSTTALIGCDGGVFYSTNVNAAPYPTFSDKNKGYNTVQYYAADIHPTAGSKYLIAGAQDNGSHKFPTSGSMTVTSASGGDGAFCHISQTNPNIQITSYVYSSFYVSTNGGTSFSNVDMNGGIDRGQFINPSDLDDANAILYFGDNSGTLGRMSGVGTTNTYGSVSYSAVQNSSLTAVKVDPNTTNRVYVGAGGKLIRIDGANGTGTATNISGASFSGNVSSIDIQQGNANHILVTFSNYGVTSVWETTDGGTNWTSVEGNLPDMPVRWGIFNPKNGDQILLATELGVWSTDNINGTSTQWFVDNIGLGNVRIDMLKARTSDYTVVAATHGRGTYTATIPGVYVAPIVQNDGFTELENFEPGRIIDRQAGANTGGGANFRVLENPFGDNLTISMSKNWTTPTTVLLSDLMGRKILEQQIDPTENSTIRLNTGGVARGTYILTLLPKNGRPQSQKIVRF